MTTTPIEKPRITITNVIWSLDPETLAVKLLLVKRADTPFQNFWALPETWLRVNESAHEATLRLVKEKTWSRFAKCARRTTRNIYRAEPLAW